MIREQNQLALLDPVLHFPTGSIGRPLQLPRTDRGRRQGGNDEARIVLTINPFGLGTNRLHDPTHMIRVSIAG